MSSDVVQPTATARSEDPGAPALTWCWTTCRAWALWRRPTDTLSAGSYRDAAAALRALKRHSLLQRAFLWREDEPQVLHRVLLRERQPHLASAAVA